MMYLVICIEGWNYLKFSSDIITFFPILNHIHGKLVDVRSKNEIVKALKQLGFKKDPSTFLKEVKKVEEYTKNDYWIVSFVRVKPFGTYLNLLKDLKNFLFEDKDAIFIFNGDEEKKFSAIEVYRYVIQNYSKILNLSVEEEEIFLHTNSSRIADIWWEIYNGNSRFFVGKTKYGPFRECHSLNIYKRIQS